MMFSDISRHQHPHNFAFPILHSPEPPTLLPGETDPSFRTQQYPGRQDDAQTDMGSPRSFQRHRQYAHPFKNEASSGICTPKALSQAFRVDQSEHMLRRKTPNGTLSAGYDGTPVEWAATPHTNKHFLVPSSEVAGSNAYQSVRRGSSGFPRQVLLNRGENGRQHMWNQATASPLNRYTFGMANELGFVKPPYMLNETLQPSLDSMLNQAPTPQSLYAQGVHQVPSLLQPVWPHSDGPTASNAHAPYGPYWPDGLHEPYRPAPFRDGRFHSRFANMNLNGPSEQSFMREHNWVENQQSYPPTPNTFFGPEQRSGREFESFDEGQSLPRRSDLGYQNEQVLLSYRGRPISAKFPPAQNSNTAWLTQDSAQSHWTTGKLQSPSNLQFKGKVLVWAHRIYMNLLKTIHETRRQNQHKQHSSGKSQFQNIFPKAPQRSHSSPRHSMNRLDSRPKLISANSENQVIQMSNGAKIGPGSQPDSKDVDFKWPYAKSHGTFHDRVDRGLRISNPAPGHPPLHLQEFRQSPGVITSPSPFTAPMFITNQQPNPPFIEAQAAFDMLARLCQESGWQWVDGLLLGGCLAYGLQDYRTALEWYQRVLSSDPENVEALSNMAATYLSLGQRDEAENFWARSVKLRPSYFEAVEHLVGLLCSDQRAREAVKVIESVEASLKIKSETHPPLRNASSVNGLANLETGQYLMGLSITSDISGGSGYRIPAADNGRLIALIHAKGNMLYALGDNAGAARSFEDAIMLGSGRRSDGIAGLINHILEVFAREVRARKADFSADLAPCETILLQPEVALKTAHLVFAPTGELPGLREVPEGQSKKAAISVASNSLLSLAKIYQDGMSSGGSSSLAPKATPGVQEILALYYLSLSLQKSPSTANNVGILLASVQQSVPQKVLQTGAEAESVTIPGVIPGSGIALALAYYNFGLLLDSRHAHLYTNLGSLLKDIGQLTAAIKMYEQAVACDGNFDIALANLANAVKDQGRISDAIGYYKRAVAANPDFAEAVCGLANALNSVCSWKGRGGVLFSNRKYDRWHVDEQGMLLDARESSTTSSGWIGRVVAIVERQLKDGQSWGKGISRSKEAAALFSTSHLMHRFSEEDRETRALVLNAVDKWVDQEWEGAKIVRLVERATKRLGWQLYQEKYILRHPNPTKYARPQLPSTLTVPSAPTVLPFHTFTCPLTANQIRKISQRNGLRISCSTLRAPWLSSTIFEPPEPPKPFLKVGYVSSDFNNHPLAHLMQSVFGFHDTSRVRAYCYATTASDQSPHREQIQREAPVFHDASSWPIDRLVKQIVDDGIHILINLNGYTRGARNEVFAARPAPIQMSFMGFAGTLGAEWCDYLLADTTSIPPSMLRPWRRNVDLVDQTKDNNYGDDNSDWVYGENIIYARDTFFCCDHKQSAPDAREPQLDWKEEQERRKRMRKELFPGLPDDAVILGNFNQLYKIEPTTFRTWLRILQNVPKAILWLLRFPELGEANLLHTALQWSSPEVVSRIRFTEVAPKHQHIARARVCDLFLDTPECNAHTTAADVLWSGTPLLTYPRYEYKMCSRMAASILKGALPRGEVGQNAAADLVVGSDEEYEQRAVQLGNGLAAVLSGQRERCRLLDLRRILYEGRWTSALFDTRRWVKDLEEAYEIAWQRWEKGEGGDIWL